MKEFCHIFVQNRLARLRACLLLALSATVACMLWLPPPDASPTYGASALAGMTVALDAGHGGYDGGARARDSGVWEKVVTLQIALETEKELLARGATVALTRREDKSLSDDSASGKARKRKDLQARVDVALAASADVLVSIHLNEYRARGESGPQVFYQRGGDDGRLLAGVLQQSLIDGLEPSKRRVAMAGDYYVLRSALPSALVECGFLSNSKEEKLLLSPEYQRRIAQSLADGLCAYRELLAGTRRTQKP